MWADLDLTVQVPVFILVAFLEYDLPLGRGTPQIQRGYVQSLFILALSHYEAIHCKKESKERKAEYRVSAEAQGKYTGMAVLTWQNGQ